MPSHSITTSILEAAVLSVRPGRESDFEGALTRTARQYFYKICGIHPLHRKRVAPDHFGINVFCLHDFEPRDIPVRRAAGARGSEDDRGTRWRTATVFRFVLPTPLPRRARERRFVSLRVAAGELLSSATREGRDRGGVSMPRFTADASHYRTTGRSTLGATPPKGRGAVTPALVGRWQIPWTRCAVTCDGQTIHTNY